MDGALEVGNAPHLLGGSWNGTLAIAGHRPDKLVVRVRLLDAEPDGVVVLAPSPHVESPTSADGIRGVPKQRRVVVAYWVSKKVARESVS